MDVGISDWTPSTTEMRHNEIWVFVDMLNALSDTLFLGWNVLPNHYHHLAEELHAGKPAEVSAIYNFWTIINQIQAELPDTQERTMRQVFDYYAGRQLMQGCLIFHYDPVRRHWVLFYRSHKPEACMICIDPLGVHPEVLSTKAMNRIVHYGNPDKLAEKPRVSGSLF